MGMYLEQHKIINIVGIDAAANEMDAGPEVFAPTFQWLRENGGSEIVIYILPFMLVRTSGIFLVDCV